MVTALREKCLANKLMKMADGRTDEPTKGSINDIVNWALIVIILAIS